MELFIKVIFYINAFIIIWAMVGYSASLKIIDKVIGKKDKKDYSHKPSVTVMIVAHNEEKVITDKLDNILEIDYPKDKIEFIVASDNSTDKTNILVKEFIADHPKLKLSLFEVKERKGKTNAQNEAQKTVTTDFLVMTDANSMLDKNSITELMASFTSDDISYVAGKVTFINNNISTISGAESSYWDSDLAIRDIESRIQTITAGNGAIYACRNKEYKDFDPIQSHDTAMPMDFALNMKRAIANHDAIAYEKAGEVVEDEFGRKVRMNRLILKHILPDIRILNIFKYKWFSYFYFGHRTCRYLLWISHLLIFVASVMLFQESWLYAFAFIGQVLFYLLALVRMRLQLKSKILTMIYYYTVTIFAQWVGVYRILSGQAKPFWEKAESTR